MILFIVGACLVDIRHGSLIICHRHYYHQSNHHRDRLFFFFFPLAVMAFGWHSGFHGNSWLFFPRERILIIHGLENVPLAGFFN